MKTAALTLGLLLALTACSAGPTFVNIESVKIQRVGSGGLHSVELGLTETRDAVACLYETREVNAEAAQADMLLQDVYLIEVKDNAGVRSFELYTGRHLKGNKGKYYQNGCIHQIISRG